MSEIIWGVYMWKIIADFIDVVFGVGLFINALLFIPQIINLLRQKHANDISLITFAGFNILNIFTVLHGITIHDSWLIIGYMFSVITNTIVTILIIWYRYFRAAY
jgi:MtN3 and saliva related transmembrane protein